MKNKRPRKGYQFVKGLFGKYEEIPEEWEISSINKLGDIVTGNTPSTSEEKYYGGKFLWATPSDLTDKKHIDNTLTKLTSEGFEQTRKLPSKTILVTCIGTVGRTGISKKSMSTNQQINSIICREHNPEFVYYQITHNHDKIKNVANQAVVPILNKTNFGNIKLLIPNKKSEQQKIASSLSLVSLSFQ